MDHVMICKTSKFNSYLDVRDKDITVLRDDMLETFGGPQKMIPHI